MYEPSKQYQYLNNVYVFFVVVVIVGYVSVCWLLPLPCVLRAIWSRTLSIRWNRTVLLHCWRIYVSTMQFGLRRTTQFDNDTTVCAYFFFLFWRAWACVCVLVEPAISSPVSMGLENGNIYICICYMNERTSLP